MNDISAIDETFDNNITKSYFLSIQISLDGFSFCTLDPIRNKYIQFKHISKPDSELEFDFVKQVLDSESLLALEYKKVFIIKTSQKATLVPNALFDQTKASDFLNFSTKVSQSDKVFFNKIKMADCWNVFAFPDELFQLTNNYFPHAVYSHQNTPFTEASLLSAKSSSDKQTIHLNVEIDFFDILVFKGNNLILSNNFKYQNENDFLYFILFIFEQLKLQPEQVEVFISGNTNENSKEIKLLRQYIKKVKLRDFSRHFTYSYTFRKIAAHEIFSITNLPLCVS